MALNDTVVIVPMREIEVDKSFNVRTTNIDVGLEELAKSIDMYGLLQPVTLWGSIGSPPYRLIVGQRRYRAHELLKKTEIKAVFYDDIENKEKARVLSLVENLQRVDLDADDLMSAISELYIEHNNNTNKVAEILGLHPNTIRKYIKVDLLASDKVKELIKKKKINITDAKRIIDAAMEDKNKQNEIAEFFPSVSKEVKLRAREYGMKNPNAGSEEIKIAALNPDESDSLLLRLPKELSVSLANASKKMSLDREMIVLEAVKQWLYVNGFNPER